MKHSPDVIANVAATVVIVIALTFGILLALI